jgi:Alkylmercury lyase
MLLFRSEEHVQRWSRTRGLTETATMPLETMWRLAAIWYGDRLDPTWRRKSPAKAQADFAELGLTGAFWRLST